MTVASGFDPFQSKGKQTHDQTFELRFESGGLASPRDLEPLSTPIETKIQNRVVRDLDCCCLTSDDLN